MIYCGGFQKSIQRKSGFLRVPNSLLKTLHEVFKGVGGSVFIHQLKAVKPRAVRVEVAPRSRVARRVASIVRALRWPCSQGVTAKTLGGYARTSPRGRAQKTPRAQVAPRPIRGPIDFNKKYMCTNAEREKIRADVIERNAAATVAATCKQVKRRFTYNIK